MPTGKRASMREGPLAALFRKTEDEGPQPPQESAPPAAEPAAPANPAAEAGPPQREPAASRRSHPSFESPTPPEPRAPRQVPRPRSACATSSPRRSPRT